MDISAKKATIRERYSPKYKTRMQILRHFDGSAWHRHISTLWMVTRAWKLETQPSLPRARAFWAKITFFCYTFLAVSLSQRHPGHIQLPSNTLRTDYERRESRHYITRCTHALKNHSLQQKRLSLSTWDETIPLIRIHQFNHLNLSRKRKGMPYTRSKTMPRKAQEKMGKIKKETNARILSPRPV